MLKVFYVVVFFVMGFAAASQSPKAKLTEKTVVKDTTGNTIPYQVWKNLLLSPSIVIYPVNPLVENSDYIIRRLSSDEQQRYAENMAKPRESKAFKTGAKFGSFNEIDITGAKYKAKELKGKVLVINFWFINCSPCRKEIPDLNNMVGELRIAVMLYSLPLH